MLNKAKNSDAFCSSLDLYRTAKVINEAKDNTTLLKMDNHFHL